jgi:hypothetical protein
VEPLNTGWSLSRETCNAELARVRGMSGTAMGVEWWILTIGISRNNGHVFFTDPLLLLRTKRQISFGVFSKSRPRDTFLSKRKVNSFSSKVIKFVIEGYLTPALDFCPLMRIDENDFYRNNFILMFLP